MEIRDLKERLYGKNMDITPNGRVYFPVKRHVCYLNRWHVKLREDGREKVKLFGLKFWKIFTSGIKNR